MPIKNFSQYLSEEKGEVYFTFGRMNPPTIGHGKVMDNLAKKSGKFDYKVYMSQKTGKKDPLSYKDKVKHCSYQECWKEKSIVKTQRSRHDR